MTCPIVRSSGGSGGGSSRVRKALHHDGNDDGEPAERVRDPPAGAIGLVDRVRDDTYLERGNARELRRPEYAEALHRLDLAAARGADPPTGPDRHDDRVGQRRAGRLEQ